MRREVKLVRRASSDGVSEDSYGVDSDAAYGVEAKISTANSKIACWVVPTNEEVMIARDVVRVGNVK